MQAEEPQAMLGSSCARLLFCRQSSLCSGREGWAAGACLLLRVGTVLSSFTCILSLTPIYNLREMVADGGTEPQRGQPVLICAVSVCGARVNHVQSDKRDPVMASGFFSNKNHQ